MRFASAASHTVTVLVLYTTYEEAQRTVLKELATRSEVSLETLRYIDLYQIHQ